MSEKLILDPREDEKEEELREMIIDALRTATILTVERKVDEITISGFDSKDPPLRGEETVIVTFVPDRDSFVLPATTKKTEREDRRTIGETLIKKKPK